MILYKKGEKYMKKFNDYKYVRPNLDELKKALTLQMEKLTDEHSFEEQYEAYLELTS